MQFECSFCGKHVGHQKTLINHFRRAHTEMKPYQCSVCNLKCASQSHLNEHISSFHDLNENDVQTPEGDVQIPKQTTKDENNAKSHDEHDETIEKKS